MSRKIVKKNGVIMNITKLEPGVLFIEQHHGDKLIVEQTVNVQYAFENINKESEDFKNKYYGKIVSGYNGIADEEFESMNVLSEHKISIYLRKFGVTLEEVINNKPLN